MGFQSLPEEIVVHICTFLCFHCQNPGIFPNADTDDVRQTKAALACLCRVSKKICSIAQPILFHYYATGNLPVTYRGGYMRSPSDDDKLPVFLRTLINRPDLARCIKSMQLQKSDILNGCTPELISLVEKACVDLGFNLPSHFSSWETCWQSEQFQVGRLHDARSVKHLLLEELAIALTPNVEMLLHLREHPAQYFYIGKGKNRKLPSLKSLALMSSHSDYHICEVKDLLNAAPNLETLYAVECGRVSNMIPEEHWAFDDTWDLPLANLKRLVLYGVSITGLKKIVECCPQLQDVEYYMDELPDAARITQALASAKGRLKRLCFGHLPIKYDDDTDYPALNNYEVTLPDHEYPKIQSLQDFDHLEELVIDQGSLFGPLHNENNSAWKLVNLLPPSIRMVHFTYVYTDMLRELVHLAREVPTSFPKLKNIKIGIADRVQTVRLPELERMRAAGVSFSEAGVKMLWARDKMGPSALTAIPGGTVGSYLTPVPVVSRL